MSTNNKVFQVLATKGNQGVAAEGTALDALKPGQVGFYDRDTSLAIGAETKPVPQAWYIAVGIGSGATVSDVRFSAGQEIQTEELKNYTLEKNAPGKPTIIQVSDIFAKCDTDYSLRVEARSLDIFNIFGFRPFIKSYAIQTACCMGCEPCPSGSKAEVAGKLVNKVNADSQAFVTAQLTVDEAVVATTADEVNAFMADAANKDKNVGILITSKSGVTYAHEGNVLQTQGFDGAAVSVFVGSGFECTGKVEVKQQGTQEEGLGHYIREREYVAGGYNGNQGIYRTSGMFNETYPQTVYMTDSTKKYHQINLVYDHHSKAGWGDYWNDLNTLLAIPVDDAATLSGVLAVIDALVAPVGMRPLAAETNEAVDA